MKKSGFVVLLGLLLLMLGAWVWGKTAVSSYQTVTITETETISDTYLSDIDPDGLVFAFGDHYRGQYSALGSTFSTTPLAGVTVQLTVLNEEAVPHRFALSCLLDHVQIPCQPDAPTPEWLGIAANGQQAATLQVGNLAPGVHDFDVLLVREVSADPAEDSLEREMPLFLYHPTTLIVDGDNHVPIVTTITGEPTHFGGNGFQFYATPGEQLYIPDTTLIPLWLEAEGNVGEILDVYLHFAGAGLSDRDAIAVMAFLNDGQVPLYQGSDPYLPLYVKQRMGRWQTILTQLRLPDEPGVYDFYILVRADAFALQQNFMATETSSRIRVQVR